jgi:hypothetical protein
LTATTPIAIIGIVELGIGLIAASLVTLKPLFNSWFSGEGTWYGRSKGSKSNNTPGSHSRSRSEFIELEDQKLSRHRPPTESEEALALDDTELRESGARYGKADDKKTGGISVTINSGRR